MKKFKFNGTVAVSTIVVILFAVLWVIPLYIIVITPFKTTSEIFTTVLSLPSSWSPVNFVNAWVKVDILHYLKNSLLITGTTLVVLSFVASLASYAITRTQKKITKSAYYVFVLGLMMPSQVGMIALFLILKGLGLYNSYPGLVCAYLGITIPVSVFLYTGFFKSIPYAIIESAYMDGCGEFVIYSRIVMPLSTSAIGTVVIYNFVSIWNDFTYPLLFVQGETWRTLPLAIYSLQGEFMSDYPLIFAGIIVAVLPILITYILLQKQFIAGMTAGAVKG